MSARSRFGLKPPGQAIRPWATPAQRADGKGSADRRCRLQRLVALALGLLLTATWAGCSGSAGSGASAESTFSASEWLERVREAYRQADSYADAGQLRLRFQRGGQPVDETVDFSVAFARPNRLRMHSYQAMVVCDGKQFRATVADLNNQVLSVPAPAELSIDSVFADDILASVLSQGIAGSAPQLALLLTDQFVESVLDGAQPPELIDPASTDGRTCQRVVIDRPEGRLTLWIDPADYVVRRIDFPTEMLQRQWRSESVGQIELWAEFRGARLGQGVDPVAFQFETPPEAKLVKRFDTRPLIPPPQPPTKLLGQTIGDFQFTDLDGKVWDRAALAGRIAVFDFWATWCEPCIESLPNLDRIYRQFRDDPRVAFFAVSVDQSDVSDEALRQRFAELGVEIPIVRDNAQHANERFLVEGIPNLFVLGPDGRVQDNEVGFNPRLADELPGRIKKLAAGDDLFPLTLANYERRRQKYEEEMNRPADEAPAPGEELTRPEVAAATQPTFLRLTPLWSLKELSQPGNLLVATDRDRTTIYVNDGWQAVAEVTPDGRVAARHELDLPEGAVISFLRTAVDGSGRRWFAGSASTQPQAFLFDDRFERRLAYPPEQGAEVGDVELADLDGDGQLELLVSYWGTRGIEAVALDGQVKWKHAGLENVFWLETARLGESHSRQVLCTHARGTLVPLDAGGQAGTALAVTDRFVRLVRAADLDDDGVDELCGLAPISASRETMVGIGRDGFEGWSYDLPAGLHQQPIELLTWGRLVPGGGGQWLAAGADGSIHILDAQGRLVDHFHYGATLTGLAVAQIEGRAVLLVATPGSIEAWSVESPVAASVPSPAPAPRVGNLPDNSGPALQ